MGCDHWLVGIGDKVVEWYEMMSEGQDEMSVSRGLPHILETILTILQARRTIRAIGSSIIVVIAVISCEGGGGGRGSKGEGG